MDEDGCTDHDPPSPISGELISFDPNGDLYLHVGAGVEEKTKTYFVCSKALARASTVFRKMLYGGFAESGHSDADHGWTVDLPEDRQQPMEMMLNIVHGAFENVPEKIELTELYTFLVVTEKYDATNITRPWAKGWMEGVKTSMQNPLLLGVAYELGDYQTFNAMAMKIATECHLDHEEDLVFGFAGENRESYTYKLKNLDCLIPDGLLGKFPASEDEPKADIMRRRRRINTKDSAHRHAGSVSQPLRRSEGWRPMHVLARRSIRRKEMRQLALGVSHQILRHAESGPHGE